jgi:predicted histone-like DNA-binding protein
MFGSTVQKNYPVCLVVFEEIRNFTSSTKKHTSMGNINYSVIKKKNPVDPTQSKYYPLMVSSTRIENGAIARYISENSQIPLAHVTSALAAIEKSIVNFVMNGHSVTIPNLGTFRPVLKLKPGKKAAATAAAVDTADYNVMVRFTPDTYISDEKNYQTRFVKLV